MHITYAFVAACVLLTASLAAAGTYGVEVTVGVGEAARYDRPVEVETDFAGLLKQAGEAGEFDKRSLAVTELDANGPEKGRPLTCQFDGDDTGNGVLVFVLSGKTPAKTTRRFQVHFGTEPINGPASKPPVKLTDGVTDEKQGSFRVDTPAGTWFYHKAGAGFSSLVDADGNDWIGYRPGGGASGEYRGIPNLVHPGDSFHPGKRGSTSRVVSAGPLKVTIASESNDGRWAGTWEVFPAFARMTVTKAPRPYWFLYEGTPGGAINFRTNYCVRAPGKRTDIKAKWNERLPHPQWLYFGDTKAGRAIWFVKHEADEAVDTYYQMHGTRGMTVFGFGRKGLGKHMKKTPATFTVGLAKVRQSGPKVEDIIESASRPLEVKIGPASEH